MIYRLKTPIAEFELRQEPLGMWDLWVDGVTTSTFPKPEDAAAAVQQKDSGYTLWDNDEFEAPISLDGWETVND